MALTGIQIFQLLPKTNCKECGVPTCLAFAMNFASGKAELDACPYVSDEAREKLAEASDERALIGIQIFQLLPKTNCKECGVPTCLAFAMNLASGKAELDACPYVSDETREKLAEASDETVGTTEKEKGHPTLAMDPIVG